MRRSLFFVFLYKASYKMHERLFIVFLFSVRSYKIQRIREFFID